MGLEGSLRRLDGACEFYILLFSCTIAVLATISLGVLNFGKFQGGAWPISGGAQPPPPPSPRLAGSVALPMITRVIV